MLKEVALKKTPEYLQGRCRGIYRGIKRVTKKLKDVHSPERKNFKKNVAITKKIDEFKSQYYGIRSEEDFLPFSQAEKIDYTYPSVNIDEDKLNAYIKGLSNSKMDTSMQQTMLLELERQPLMSPAALDKN